MCPFLRHKTTQPGEVSAHSAFYGFKVLHIKSMMHYAYKIKRIRHILSGALANSHHWQKRCPFHIEAVGVTCAITTCVAIKGKDTVQSSNVRRSKMSYEREKIHI